MFDDIFDIFSGYNLIAPLASFFQDIISGPPCHFGVPSMAGWTKREIGRMLSERRIEVWGLIYDGDIIIFTVHQDKARFAHRVLSYQGVPILFPRFGLEEAPLPQEKRGILAAIGLREV